MWNERKDLIIEINDLYHLLESICSSIKDEGMYSATILKINTLKSELDEINNEE